VDTLYNMLCILTISLCTCQVSEAAGIIIAKETAIIKTMKTSFIILSSITCTQWNGRDDMTKNQYQPISY